MIYATKLHRECMSTRTLCAFKQFCVVTALCRDAISFRIADACAL